MNSSRSIEHFITLFDSKYLPLGMALHNSLMIHAQPFHLWILCMDELVEKQLKLISLPNVTLIPLKEIETEALLAVKPGRNQSEYCWTLTPFTFYAVFDRDNSVERVTYLDADIFFFSNPQILLRELDETGKHVLITEHAYAPQYNHWLSLRGRFCVQFMTVRSTVEAKGVVRWWQDKCLEWCFARLEDGKFGDQKYLDCWPELFSKVVHIVQQVEKTLAPWNVLFFEKKIGTISPVFYHFHAFRIVSPNKVRLWLGYKIGKQGFCLYNRYLENVKKQLNTLKKYHIPTPYIEQKRETWGMLRYFKRKIMKTACFALLNYL